MKRFLTAPLTAVALLLILGAGARANLIPPEQIQWTYNFTPGSVDDQSFTGPISLTADARGDGTPGTVAFTNEPDKLAKGSSDIVATNLRVSSAFPASSADTITGVNGQYFLRLKLTATDFPEQTATLTFSGTLSGSFSNENANLMNDFGNGVGQPGEVQVAVLGNYRFTVQLVAYTPPGPPDQANAGSISAHVTVENIGGGANQAPEPSTILLSGLGLTFLGGAAWRKRRAARG